MKLSSIERKGLRERDATLCRVETLAVNGKLRIATKRLLSSWQMTQCEGGIKFFGAPSCKIMQEIAKVSRI